MHGYYADAIDAYNAILLRLEQSPHPDIRGTHESRLLISPWGPSSPVRRSVKNGGKRYAARHQASPLSID